VLAIALHVIRKLRGLAHAGIPLAVRAAVNLIPRLVVVQRRPPSPLIGTRTFVLRDVFRADTGYSIDGPC
jgi:hypothetical protein